MVFGQIRIKFPAKIRDIHKIEKRIPSISVSKKCCEEKHVDLLLRGERKKKHYVLFKVSNTFMCDHSLHRGRRR